MRILFWNLAKNCNEDFVAKILAEQDIDIAIFAEHHNTDFSSVVKSLDNKYINHLGYGACEKITLLARKAFQIEVKREQTRYVLYSFQDEQNQYIIAGIHLPANPHSSSDDRKCVIRDIVGDITELENKLDCHNTIVIGDFNASPFDSELTQKDAFNAVLFQDLITKKEYVISNGKRYRRFYNPVFNFLSETTKNYGSIYYSGNINSLYWYCYDQIIVRKPLISSIKELNYVKRVKGRNLIKETLPDKSISDHLPLFVELKG